MAFSTTRSHCWPVFCFSVRIPKSFSAKLLSIQCPAFNAEWGYSTTDAELPKCLCWNFTRYLPVPFFPVSKSLWIAAFQHMLNFHPETWLKVLPIPSSTPLTKKVHRYYMQHWFVILSLKEYRFLWCFLRPKSLMIWTNVLSQNSVEEQSLKQVWCLFSSPR